MRRLLMLAGVMVAMVALLAIPAVAQPNWNWNNNPNWNWNNNPNWNWNWNHPNGFFNSGVSQGIANESESGDVTPSFSVQSTGNNSNQCVTPLQFGNTGNFNNAQGSLSIGNGFDNGFGFSPFFDGFGNSTELEGGQFDFSPVLNGGCTQSVEQSSAASSY